MKKLNVTKEEFSKSKYFTTKYGKLEYVSESGKVYKTSKGQLIKFNESDYDSLIKKQWWDLDVIYIKKPGKTSLMYKDSEGDDICFKWSEVKSILADFQRERGESGDIDEWIATSGIIADHGIEILDDLVTEVEENPEMRPVFCYGGPEI